MTEVEILMIESRAVQAPGEIGDGSNHHALFPSQRARERRHKARRNQVIERQVVAETRRHYKRFPAAVGNDPLAGGYRSRGRNTAGLKSQNISPLGDSRALAIFGERRFQPTRLLAMRFEKKMMLLVAIRQRQQGNPLLLIVFDLVLLGRRQQRRETG